MEITAEQLREKIKNGDKIIVDFYTSWCGPCKMMKPIFEKVASEINEQETGVKLYTFNAESDSSLSVELGIRSVPTIKSFNGGSEVYSRSGIHGELQIKDLSKQLLNG
jgi:thioredoxin